MVEKIPDDISDLITSTLKEKLENLEVIRFDENEKGQGHLGDIIFISVRKKESSEDYHLVIKQALHSTTEGTRSILSTVYSNEIYFYSKIIPILRDFQKSYPEVEMFENIAECYKTVLTPGKEKLVLDNLKFKNYELHPLDVPLNGEMYEALFKMYGKYHALSYAFKCHHPEEFLKLTSCLENNVAKFLETDFSKDTVQYCCNKIKEYLEQEGEIEMMIRFEKYFNDGVNLYKDDTFYKSPYSVIIHGDTWSNNLMFKFNESRNIEDIKMLDFQLTNLGTPVIDLTYNFYSGATKDILDNFEHFLRIYHTTLSDTLRKYGCDPNKSLPYEALKKEWKEHNAYGFISSMIIWAIKCTDSNKGAGAGVAESIDGETKENFLNPNEKKFKEIILNLCRHLNKYDLI